MTMQKSKDINASGITGTLCTRSGPYKCGTHGEIIVFFKRGATFTACPAQGHSTNWVMVRTADSVAAAG